MAIAELRIPSLNKTYVVDTAHLSYEEVEAMEDQLDVTLAEFSRLLSRGSAKATKILLWFAMRRENPKVAFKDVPFELYDFEATRLDDEKEAPQPNRAARRASLPKDAKSVSR